MKIGVLGLQGDVREHVEALERAGAAPVVVRHGDDIAAVDGLVVPGGESTTIGKLLSRFELLDPLRARIVDGLPVYGTCAGLILMAREVAGAEDAPHRLACLDVTVRRNAYGRQTQSFEADLDVAGWDESFRAVFIRAPVVERVGEDVDVLATWEGTPVMVRQGRMMATSFHPEMTEDVRVHELFVSMID